MAFKKDNPFERNDPWDFEKNKTIEGALVDKRFGVSSKNLNFYTIEVEGGKKYSLLGGVVLDKTLGTYTLGTVVKVTYKGMKKSDKGNPFKDYEVEYDPETGKKESGPTNTTEDDINEVFGV